MQKQITHISPFQTAKVVAVYSFVMTIPLILIALLSSLLLPDAQRVGIVLAIFAPALYAVVGFVFTFIGAYVYNVVAKFIGGIEFTTTDVRDF